MNDATRGLIGTGIKLPLAGFVVDLGSEELRDARGRIVELRPQAFRQVLRFFVLNAGRLVTKDELLEAVWPGLVVTDDSLVHAIGDVRRALGDNGHRLFKTVPRRGYMLVADALAPPAEDLQSAALPDRPSRTSVTTAATSREPAPDALQPDPRRRGLAWIAAAVVGLGVIGASLLRPAVHHPTRRPWRTQCRIALRWRSSPSRLRRAAPTTSK